MLNILRMDLYRTTRAKSTWILFFVAFVLVLIGVFFRSLMIQLTADMPSDAPLGEMLVGEGITIAGNYTSQIGLNILMLLTIFVILLVNLPYRSGFIKTVDGQVSHRWVFVVSEWIVSALFTLILLLVAFAAAALSTVLFFKEPEIGDVQALLSYFGTQYVLHLAMATVFIFVATLIRSAAGVLTVGLVYVSILAPFLWIGIQQLIVVKLFPDTTFNLLQYIPTQIVTNLSLKATTTDHIRSLVVALICLAIFLAGAIVIAKKKDIA